MVFPSLPDPPPHSPMAPRTLLHNFPLHDLKWSINRTNSHHFRQPAHCPRRLLHFVSDVSPAGDNARAPGSSSQLSSGKSEKKLRVSSSLNSPNSPAGNSVKKPRNKICIRLKKKQINPPEEPAKPVKKLAEEPAEQVKPAGEPTKQVKKLDEEPAEQVQQVKPAEELAIPVSENQGRLDVAEESIAKTWRRELIKGRRRKRGVKKLSVAQEEGRLESLRPRGANDAVMAERKGKEKREDEQEQPKKTEFSFPLTKLEIEEDICALTGSKPSGKPFLKRPKHVQKQLDNLFPGMWLSSITPDKYKVHETTPAKIR